MEIKVVIVDNAEDLLEKLEGILSQIKGVVVAGVFQEGVAVVEYVKEHPVDLVFTDIVMPDVSGISLAKELYRLKEPPAVVLMSSIPGFSLEAWQIRAFGFIEKPYTRAQIAEMVEKYRHWLAQGRSETE